MPRLACLLFVLFLAGCSTAPIANTLDFFCPGKMYPDQKGLAPYGGVGIPQGAIMAPPPGVTIGVPVVTVPGPVPVPGNLPPGGVQIMPPLPPPLPPPPPTPFGK